MAHEIENENIFTVGEKPWHRLGTVLDNPPTIEEGIKCAGLDWEVEKRPMTTAASDPTASPLIVPGKYATVRTSDDSVLGVVGDFYKPVQNLEAFNWFEPFLTEGSATLECAGSLFDGKKIWVLAKLQSKTMKVAKNDEIEKYILLSNSHDGSSAVKLGFTPIRVVCNNTLQMSDKHKDSQLVRVFHCSKVHETMEAVRNAMNLADQQFEATLDEYKALAKKDINATDLKNYIKKVFRRDFVQTEEEHAENEIPTEEKESKLITAVTELFETGQGSELKSAKGTYWGAYNSVVEYLQYYQGKDEEMRLGSIWFKHGRKHSQRALAYATAA